MIIRSAEAVAFQQPGVTGRSYSLQGGFFGQCFVYGELDGEHGERVSTENPRLYYILGGDGRFEIDGETMIVGEGDLVLVPPETRHNYWSGNTTLKFVLVMETH